ncbi:unnamed protein product [Blepharisma stoltei]|uniref:Glutaredoxin domain-containing protein n=1 Tax=Blepharisma stoltei TaxID=1481888 RepID=A0AAU9J8I9_9CILI|nr:unnamed protein product [Blepharisma stoltei]
MGCYCSGEDRHSDFHGCVNPFVQVVNDQIKEYDVIIYSKSKDEKSFEAKNLLRKYSIAFEYFELDKLNDDNQVHCVLVELTEKRHPPYIFINGKFWGGIVELQKGLESGEIKALLA